MAPNVINFIWQQMLFLKTLFSTNTNADTLEYKRFQQLWNICLIVVTASLVKCDGVIIKCNDGILQIR